MVGGQRHTTAALPPRKTRYPLYRRLDRLQGRSGRVLQTSPLPGFDPRTVQPVASRYNDYAILAHSSSSSSSSTCSFTRNSSSLFNFVLNVKLFLWLIKHDTMNTCGGVDVALRILNLGTVTETSLHQIWSLKHNCCLLRSGYLALTSVQFSSLQKLL